MRDLEIDHERAGPQLMRSLHEQHGSFVFRGLFSPDVVGGGPSLESVVGSPHYMRGVADENPGITQISENWIEAHLRNLPRWTPHCKPGDVLVFDHHTVHRTQRLAEPSDDRMSIEFR